MKRPTVLLFDVNETLLDIEALAPFFERVFGDRRVLREWYAQLVIYSQAATLTGRYVPFGELGVGILGMLGAIHGKPVHRDDRDALAAATTSLPAHDGVVEALRQLRGAGFRLATLTNSPPSSPSPLQKAGLAPFFEVMASVDAVQRFKPAPDGYRHAAAALGVAPPDICMVAAHVWDLLGAAAVGCSTALVTWSANAPLEVGNFPQPDLVAPSMAVLADTVIARWT